MKLVCINTVDRCQVAEIKGTQFSRLSSNRVVYEKGKIYDCHAYGVSFDVNYSKNEGYTFLEKELYDVFIKLSDIRDEKLKLILE